LASYKLYSGTVFLSVCTPSDPCQNGGACDEMTDSCTCPPPYAGNICDKGEFGLAL